MKKIFLIVIFFLSLCMYSQSKKETIDWLNTKLQYTPISISGNMESTFKTQINDDGTLSNMSTQKAQITGYSDVTIFSGHLSKLNPNSLKIHKNSQDRFYISAICTTGNCISQDSSYENGEKANYKINEITLCVIDDVEVAERCKKAFTHLIRLYGGKKEIF